MAVKIWAVTALAALSACSASAMTVRTKSDLRLWQTVTDRSAPLAWSWEPGADAATLTFSNRLTRAVSSVSVARGPEARRGSCPHPVPSATDEGLVAATLAQFSNGVEIVRTTAEIAYVPGTAHGGASRPMTVRAKACTDWARVERPRLSAFDARWWGLVGPSGYDVMWSESFAPQRVVRTFGGQVVDWADLVFRPPGFLLFVR